MLILAFLAIQIQTRQGGLKRTEILLEHCSPPFELAPDHGPRAKVVASSVFLGRYQIL